MTRLGLLIAMLFTALPAAAQDAATGDAIRAAISGNTVQGAMSDATAYTEFYEARVLIKGKDYTGTWTIDGDRMCFSYGTDAATCFGVRIAADQVTWLKDGAETGTGTILAGNPNSF